MLTCIACSKLGGATAASAGPLHHPAVDDDDDVGSGGAATPSTRQAIKALTAQIKDMAMKASGAYRHCKPCAGAAAVASGYADPEASGLSSSERFCYSYRRAAAALGSAGSTPGRTATARQQFRVNGVNSNGGGLSSGDATPAASVSWRTQVTATSSLFVMEEEEEPREWEAQVEPGVLITFVSMPHGGNDLKRIRFSREMFSKWQAQRWWAENYDRVMELYNVQRFNHQAVPLPTPPRSEDESSKMESAESSPMTTLLSKESLPRNLHRPMTITGSNIGYSSSDSLERSSHAHHHHNGRHYYDSGGLTSTPKLSSISCAKTETSSMDASVRTSSSRGEEEIDRSGELSISNASEQETEWVEEDEPGVYITIRALPGGIRELRRVRFSRERFGETHARLWWEENRARIHQQYL